MREISLTRGYVALVDDEDYEFLNQWKWKAVVTRSKNTEKVYACRTPRIGPRSENKYASVVMHRLIMNTPKGKVTDHINGNTLDNRRENLRICTQAENLMNKQKTYGKSSYKGVIPHGHRWVAIIGINGKRLHLGYFSTEVDAAKAYNIAARFCFGSFAKFNKIEE